MKAKGKGSALSIKEKKVFTQIRTRSYDVWRFVKVLPTDRNYRPVKFLFGKIKKIGCLKMSK